MLDFDNTFGTIEMFCDTVGCDHSELFEGFDGHCDIYSAVKDAKDSGWRIYKEDGEWVHLCPTCVEIEKGESNGK